VNSYHKTPPTTNVGKDAWKKKPLDTIGGNVKNLENNMEAS
jgi:hypothetical protein